MGRATSRQRILRVREGEAHDGRDTLAAEEPLEIRVGGEPLTVTMRTPGDDFDLVAGFLVAEGVIGGRDDLPTLRYCSGTDESGANTYNVLDAALGPDARTPLTANRRMLTSSACGICGQDTIDAVRTHRRWSVAEDSARVSFDTLFTLPERLREAQRVFAATGGLHAAGLFTADGELRCVREDVGRHNAVDKVLGWALTQGLLPLSGHVLLVSGRASFELTQKTAMAGAPMLAAVSAPSNLAVDLAVETGLTLVGFLRGRNANVYTGQERLTATSPAESAPGTPPAHPARS